MPSETRLVQMKHRTSLYSLKDHMATGETKKTDK